MNAPATAVRRPGARGAFLLAAGIAAGSLLGVAAAAPPEEPKRASIEDMDLALLQQRLLRIYIIEKESGINEMRLLQQKVASQTVFDPTKQTLTEKPTPEQIEDIKKRHKTIVHYLTLEKSNAMEAIHIVDRVLGTEVHLPGEGRPERKFLEQRIEVFEIPRKTDFREVAQKVGEVLGCKVETELPPLETFFITTFYMERSTGEALIKQLCSQLPLTWKFEGKTLKFRHVDLPEGGSKADELDEEEKRALEELKKKEKGR